MWRTVALAAAAFALAGCAHKQRTALPAIPVKIGHVETGIASWYGKPYDGRPTASGEIYDMEAMVAAHKTMPFQTWVRVYNLSNQKTVDVRITDRGPFVKGRIIDLSHAAAMAIDMVGPGTAKVRLVVIKPDDAVIVASRRQTPVQTVQPLPGNRVAASIPDTPVETSPVAPPASPPAPPPATTTPPIYSVQIGAFPDRESANRMRDKIGPGFGLVQVLQRSSEPGLWRVYVGAESTEEAANALADRIREKSNEKNAFVVRLDLQ
ncbi:MAG TPA: septal ring lytic transglycosylase RlpA family protein [Verrucomicrobiae bacterium]|nr:septal ring lytic transglycosylase RlpA family protein [Verrucomicrobiae bacterium]